MVSDPAPLPDLTRRDTFRHWARIPIRYNDLDTLGHVNNAATSVYLEQARCELLYPIIGPERKPEIDLVMARLIIDYRRELTFPGVIEVGSSVVRQGTKSFHLAHGIFRAGTDDCVSTGESILVWYSLVRRASMVPPEDIRAAMMGFAIR